MFNTFANGHSIPPFIYTDGVNWVEKLPNFLQKVRPFMKDIIDSLIDKNLLTLRVDDPEFGVIAHMPDITADLATELGISERDLLVHNNTNPSERILLLVQHIVSNCGELVGALPRTLYQELIPVLREVISEKFAQIATES